ncbi:hypothetical protein [Bacillus paramobilis]|nr:hypothetical protein [Bacillus paramobilis]
MKIKANSYKRKMDSEELQAYLKTKKQGNGQHKNKKAYDRKKGWD